MGPTEPSPGEDTQTAQRAQAIWQQLAPPPGTLTTPLPDCTQAARWRGPSTQPETQSQGQSVKTTYSDVCGS